MTRLLSIVAAVVLGFLFLRALVAVPRADWPNQHTAARQFLRGTEAGAALYDAIEMQRLVDREGYRGFLGTYVPQPPAALLPYVPAAPLRATLAKPLFGAATLGLFLASVLSLGRLAGASVAAVIATLASVGGAVTANLHGGQEMLLVAALLTTAVAAVMAGRAGAAGAAAGAALALKLFGLPWCALWVMRGRLRPLAAAAVVALLLTAIPALALGTEFVTIYVTDVLPESLAGNFHDLFHPASQSLETIIRRLFLPHPDWNPAPPVPSPATYGFLARALPLGLIGVGLAAGWRWYGQDAAGALATQLPFLLLAAPTVTRYHLAALAPVLLLAAGKAPRARATRLLFTGTAIACWVPAGSHALLQEPRVIGLSLAVAATLVLRPPTALTVAAAIAAALASGILLPVRRPAAPAAWQRLTRVPFPPLVARMPSRDGSALELAYAPGPHGTTFSWEGYARDRSLTGELLLERLTDAGRSGVLHDDGAGHQSWLLALPDADVRRPRFAGSGILVDIVSAAGVHSMFLEPAAGTASDPPRALVPTALPPGAVAPGDVSPDGRFEAYALRAGRRTEIRERERATGRERVLVAAVARSIDPRYSWDGRSLFFASDAGRCAGCPVVYRIGR